jgi:Domain of unknown function (DUF4388)
VRGSLGIFNLVDLLQLLAANHSKGLLTVHHPSRGECKLYLDGSGRMLHAAFDDREGIPAIKAILEDEHGNFEFLPNLSPTVKSIDANLDNVLFQAIRELESQKTQTVAEKHVAPPQELDTPRVKSIDRLSNLTLSGEEFAVIEKMDGQMSAIGIAQSTGIPLERVQTILTRLASISMIEIKRREVRIAQLVIGLSRELVGTEACIDEVILNAWERQANKKVRGIRIREKSGREIVFPTMSRPGLGAYLLLSNNSIMQFGLQAGKSVLAKPEM